MELGEKIGKFLKDNGISQSYISKKIDMSPSKLNLTLNGHRKMTFLEYELICGVLKVNTDKFLKPRVPGTSKETG